MYSGRRRGDLQRDGDERGYLQQQDGDERGDLPQDGVERPLAPFYTQNIVDSDIRKFGGIGPETHDSRRDHERGTDQSRIQRIYSITISRQRRARTFHHHSPFYKHCGQFGGTESRGPRVEERPRTRHRQLEDIAVSFNNNFRTETRWWRPRWHIQDRLRALYGTATSISQDGEEQGV